MKKYTDDDMLEEINKIRFAVKNDLNAHLQAVRKIKELSKELERYLEIQIRYL